MGGEDQIMFADVIVPFAVSVLFLYAGLLAIDDGTKARWTWVDKAFASGGVCIGTFGIGVAGVYLGRMFPLMFL